MVTLHGERVQGSYVLFRTDGKNWMIHRMDPPRGSRPRAAPGQARADARHAPATLPRDDGRWAYEIKWDGVRAIGYVEGGRMRLVSRNGNDITPRYPELRALGRALGGPRRGARRRDRGVRRRRPPELPAPAAPHAPDVRARRAPAVAERAGRLHDLRPAVARRALADGAAVHRAPRAAARARPHGAAWQTPAHHVGDGAALLEARARRGSRGSSPSGSTRRTRPGARTPAWVKVKNFRAADVVVGGWLAGEGGRSGRLGSLVIGVYDGRRAALRRARRLGLRRRASSSGSARCSSRWRARTARSRGRHRRARRTSSSRSWWRAWRTGNGPRGDAPPPGLQGAARRRGAFGRCVRRHLSGQLPAMTPNRKLAGEDVFPIGLGGMPMSLAGHPPEERSIRDHPRRARRRREPDRHRRRLLHATSTTSATTSG